MTPTEAIAALEKALEAYLRNAGPYARDNDTVIVTALELRTLLDAHAGALRDAERYRWISFHAEVILRKPVRFEISPGVSIESCYPSLGAELDEAIDAARAALATNTTGAV